MQKYHAITADLSVGDLMDFVNRFKDALYVEGLVQGNFTSAVSLIDNSFPFEQVFVLELLICVLFVCTQESKEFLQYIME